MMGAAQTMDMFKGAGFSAFKQTFKNDRPDLVVFLGGEDIDPALYGEPRLTQTRSINPRRDAMEKGKFELYKGIPKVGICRGGQMLNVLSGGSMFQHVDNHTNSHGVVDLLTEDYMEVTSTHHQMMVPGEGAEVLAIAWEATQRLSGTKREQPDFDTEAVWYEKTNSLCFQPHPEYQDNDCRDLFFSYIKYFWDMGQYTSKEQKAC